MKTLDMFYASKTCRHLHDKRTGLYLYGDLYIADEFMLEMQENLSEQNRCDKNV